MDYFVGDLQCADPEEIRRAQLVAGLSMLGVVFGSCYVAFYLAIGHLWGAAIILVCTISMVCVPFSMRASGRVEHSGNLTVFIWVIGFSALTAVEGGVRGHSIAWLACGVPLLALLILDWSTALIWCGICCAMTLVFCALELAYGPLPLGYPRRWYPAVTSAGYLGLAVFMALLGVLFETSRKQAFLMMQAAVTERARVEGEKQAAEEASRSKDQFLAVLSHELRTPLTPVLATVTGAERRTDLPDEMRADLEMIQRNVELEASLIDDLLDVTRIRSGKIALNLKVVDAHACLEDTLEICRSEIEAKSLMVVLMLEASEHYVRGDPARLHQIFWNLVRNAIKFTPAGGRLSFRSNNAATRLKVEVSDTGIGIGAEVLPVIFEAFEQGGKSKTRLFGGLGLGLSIVKGLVEMHRGEVTAFSEGKNKGATFTVDLPTVLPLTDVAPPVPIVAAPVKAGPSRILLVEDHVDSLETMAKLLRRQGYEVLTAGNVREALETAAKEPLDLLVSDLGLPDGSGLDIMRELKLQYGLHGIALSGFGTDEDIRRSREAGFDEHLVKPLKFQAVRDSIRRIS